MSTEQNEGISRSSGVALGISMLSLILSAVTIYLSQTKDFTVDLKSSTRDWQRGVIFSTLLYSSKPLTIDDIEEKYRTSASAYRDKYKLKDPNFSREEIYSVLLDLIGSQSVKMRDNKYFGIKTDEDATQDRRIAFDMLEFTLSNEYRYGFDEFASQFSEWYRKNKGNEMSKDRAFVILALSMQNNILQLAVKPGFRLSCYGETPPMFVASNFSIRTNAPALLPMPGQLQPCPPK